MRLWIAALAALLAPAASRAQVAVKAKAVHTAAGALIEDGMVIFRDGKIAAVGKASDLKVPEGFTVLEAAVVTPGLIDAHCVVGLAGYYNQAHDQDQLERSSPLQPELRAIDAYNPREHLVEWLRGFGITAIDLDSEAGRLALQRCLAFLAKRASPSARLRLGESA